MSEEILNVNEDGTLNIRLLQSDGFVDTRVNSRTVGRLKEELSNESSTVSVNGNNVTNEASLTSTTNARGPAVAFVSNDKTGG
tara:strand:- start:370 stop:618 length:249 start_codon:yes stop_codon:yes gene_type:complete